jgi:hypothetical protein
MKAMRFKLSKIWRVFLIVTIFLGINPPLVEASVKINPGKLLNAVINEISKEESKSNPGPTPEPAPEPASAPTPAPTQTSAPQEVPVQSSGKFDINKLMKVAVPEDTPLRVAPSAKSNAVMASDYGSGTNKMLICSHLFVDPTPIPGQGENSKWYKILFYTSPWEPGFVQLNKSSNTGYAYLYVETNKVSQSQIDEFERKEIEYFKQGRPQRIAVGDSLATVKKVERDFFGGGWDRGGFRIATTTAPNILHRAPKNGEATFTLPKGTKIIDPIPSGRYGTDSYDLLGRYIDMNEDHWLAVIDGNTQKVVGWSYTSNEKRGDNFFDKFVHPTDQEIQDLYDGKSQLWKY